VRNKYEHKKWASKEPIALQEKNPRPSVSTPTVRPTPQAPQPPKSSDDDIWDFFVSAPNPTQVQQLSVQPSPQNTVPTQQPPAMKPLLVSDAEKKAQIMAMYNAPTPLQPSPGYPVQYAGTIPVQYPSTVQYAVPGHFPPSVQFAGQPTSQYQYYGNYPSYSASTVPSTTTSGGSVTGKNSDWYFGDF
jgi:hypothetical protein